MDRILIDWAVAAQAMAGHGESGDRAWAKVSAARAQVAVVDGLGHGGEAARAAFSAISTIEEFANDSPSEIFKHCHANLKATRGAVMSYAEFQLENNTMTWLGVGNVEGVLLRRRRDAHAREREILVQRPGVLGDTLPMLSSSVVKVAPGDVLIFATDGLANAFADGVNPLEPLQKIADRILDRHGKGTDDALVLVARYGYGQGEDKLR